MKSVLYKSKGEKRVKHTIPVIGILVAGFFMAQLIGVFVVAQHISIVEGEIVWEAARTLAGPVETGVQGWNTVWLFITLLFIGIPLMLLIMYLGWVRLWKLWYGFAMFICLDIAFAAFIQEPAAATLAIFLTGLKMFKPGVLVHNLAELFMYGGLATIFVPMLTPTTAAVLLLLMSVYDAYAVLKSGFMVRLAKFQTSSGAFAGMILPYQRPKKAKKGKTRRAKIAILGGGDIAFPLLFTGSIAVAEGVPQALLITPFTTLGLLTLLLLGKKGKFYPALPFVTAGCIVGWGAVKICTWSGFFA